MELPHVACNMAGVFCDPLLFFSPVSSSLHNTLHTSTGTGISWDVVKMQVLFQEVWAFLTSSQGMPRLKRLMAQEPHFDGLKSRIYLLNKHHSFQTPLKFLLNMFVRVGREERFSKLSMYNRPHQLL